jgi:tetratricopeptide (TPR) repeat protein
MLLPPVDAQLASARHLADEAAWDELIALLQPMAARGATGDELAVLYGEALTRTRRERDAQSWLRPVVALLGAGPDRALHRRAMNVLGVSCFRVGDLGEAADAFGSALELANDAQDSLLVARASNNLGMIANTRGQWELALSYYRRAIPTYQRSGRAQGLAETHHNMAVTFRDLEQLDEADVHEQRAIHYAAEGRAPRLAAMGRLGRGELALRRGDADLAAATARHAVGELEELHDPLNQADAWRLLGCALCQSSLLADSGEAFSQALLLARRHGHVFNEAEALRDRIGLWIRLQERALAAEDASAALAIFHRLGAAREVEGLTTRLQELRGT